MTDNEGKFAQPYKNYPEGYSPITEPSQNLGNSLGSFDTRYTNVTDEAALNAAIAANQNAVPNATAVAEVTPNANASVEANLTPLTPSANNTAEVAANVNATAEANLTPLTPSANVSAEVTPAPNVTPSPEVAAAEAPALQPLANFTPASPPTETVPTATSPPPAPAPAAPAPLGLPPLAPKPKVPRSQKQAEADAGQAEMLKTLKEIYDREFANIPENKRPKPKAYIARAAYYKQPGRERDEYIAQYLLEERELLNAESGKNIESNYNTGRGLYSRKTHKRHLKLASLASVRGVGFEGEADRLREQATKAGAKLEGIAMRTEAALLKKARDPASRSAAKHLAAEAKRQAKELAKEAKRQAAELEKAAKAAVREQAAAAFAELERKAAENLTIARAGVKPNKILTHRLARKREAGNGVTAENFLTAEAAAGRYHPPKPRGRTKKVVAAANNSANVSAKLAANVATKTKKAKKVKNTSAAAAIVNASTPGVTTANTVEAVLKTKKAKRKGKKAEANAKSAEASAKEANSAPINSYEY